METLRVVYPFGSYVSFHIATGSSYARLLDRINRYRPMSGMFYALYWDADRKKPVDLSDRITPFSNRYLYL